MDDENRFMESGQPLPPPQLPDAFSSRTVPPPLPPEYLAEPPAVQIPNTSQARSPRLTHKRRKLFMATGVALALVALVAGGIAFAASQSSTSSSANTASANTMTGASNGAKHTPVIYTVTAINGGAITATESGTGATVTIATSAQTAIVRAGQPASLSDITVGTKLRVKGHKKAGSITAKKIEIVLPSVEGKVTGVTASAITVQTRHGTVTVDVSGATVIVDAQTRQPVALSAIQTGEKIHAEGTQNGDGSLTALYILVGAKGDKGGSPAPTSPTSTASADA